MTMASPGSTATSHTATPRSSVQVSSQRTTSSPKAEQAVAAGGSCPRGTFARISPSNVKIRT